MASGVAKVRWEVREVIGECVKLKPNLVVAELLAGKPRPVDRVLAFLDVLLRFAALIVEGRHPIGRAVQVGHDEAVAGNQPVRMPLDLSHHPARAVPALGLVVEAHVVAPDGLRRSADGPRQQVRDAPLEDLADFLGPFSSLVRRPESVHAMERYTTGLVSDLPRKTASRQALPAAPITPTTILVPASACLTTWPSPPMPC